MLKAYVLPQVMNFLKHYGHILLKEIIHMSNVFPLKRANKLLKSKCVHLQLQPDHLWMRTLKLLI